MSHAGFALVGHIELPSDWLSLAARCRHQGVGSAILKNIHITLLPVLELSFCCLLTSEAKLYIQISCVSIFDTFLTRWIFCYPCIIGYFVAGSYVVGYFLIGYFVSDILSLDILSGYLVSHPITLPTTDRWHQGKQHTDFTGVDVVCGDMSL